MQVLVIDNYDSFTYNLVILLKEVEGVAVTVLQNTDELPYGVEDKFDAAVISPGPGHPAQTADVGISSEVFTATNLPVLGVCLGYQLMAFLEGAVVTEAKSPIHGEVSQVHHDGDELFDGIPETFDVVRYHSLEVVKPGDRLRQIAWAEDGTLMASRVPGTLRWGVQFHPESIGSKYGQKIIRNFLKIVKERVPNRKTWVSKPDSIVQHAVAGVRSIPLCNMLDILDEPPRIILDGITSSSNTTCTILGWTDGPLARELRSMRGRPIEIVSSDSNPEVSDDDVFSVLEDLSNVCYRLCPNEESIQPIVALGYAGFIGYEAGYRVLDIPVGDVQRKRWGLDAWFALLTRAIVIEAGTQKVSINWLSTTDSCEKIPPWVERLQRRMQGAIPSRVEKPSTPNTSLSLGSFSIPESKYLSLIEACQSEIHKGNSYELCLTNSVQGEWDGSFLELFEEIRGRGTVPYSAFLRIDEEKVVISGSPELLLKVSPDGHAVSRPIKGTRAASDSEPLRKAAYEELRNSKKDQAENLMIVDLVRHEFNQHAQLGSTTVTELFGIYEFPTVLQMISTIECDISPKSSALKLLRSVFPPGSMTGAPKKRSVEILRHLEKDDRGVYSGSIGYVGFDRQISFNVAIRTLEFSGRKYHLGVGGAITRLSDPLEEWQEVGFKAVASQRAMDRCVVNRMRPARLESVTEGEMMKYLEISLEEFKGVLRDMGYPTEHVTDSSLLTPDVGLDSLGLMELALQLGKFPGFTVSDEEVASLGSKSVGEIRIREGVM